MHKLAHYIKKYTFKSALHFPNFEKRHRPFVWIKKAFPNEQKCSFDNTDVTKTVLGQWVLDKNP